MDNPIIHGKYKHETPLWLIAYIINKHFVVHAVIYSIPGVDVSAGFNGSALRTVGQQGLKPN